MAEKGFKWNRMQYRARGSRDPTAMVELNRLDVVINRRYNLGIWSSNNGKIGAQKRRSISLFMQRAPP